MIYAYDQWIPMPVKDIYDTKVMAMAIDAAKDMYEKGEQAIKDFKKEYGDFSTQLPKDAEFYKREFDYGDFLNSLYDRGIDPTRSVEGRAELNKWLYSRPYDTYNRAKKNAEVYDEYLKNRDKLRQAGLYDEDQERFYFPFDPNQFSSEKGDVFNRYSPVRAKTLEEITSDIYKGRTPYELSKEEVESFGVPFDPRAKYTGYSYNALLTDAGKGLPGLQGTPGLDYFKDLAKRKLINAGITNPTDDQVNTQLQYDVANANLRQLVRPTSSMSDWINMQKLYAMRSRAAEKRAAEKKEKKTTSEDKESLSDAQYQFMRATANIIKGTSFGRAYDISSYTDFDPDKFNGLITGAQAEKANKYYTKNISGRKDVKLNVTSRPIVAWDNDKNKFVSSPINSLTKPSSISISEVPSMLPATTEDDKNRLKQANMNFINELSIDYSPAKFAKWTNRSTDTKDSTMILISHDDDAVNRLYSIDEVALNSYGVNRPDSDLQWSRETTNSARKALNKKSDKLYIKSTGAMFPHVEKDGSVHLYQIVNVYTYSGNENNKTFNKVNVGKMAYDMGITSYNNPNFGIAGDTSTNLYFDENKDADTRWTGDQNVLHWEHVGAPQINSTIAYPQISSDEEQTPDEDYWLLGE